MSAQASRAPARHVPALLLWLLLWLLLLMLSACATGPSSPSAAGPVAPSPAGPAPAPGAGAGVAGPAPAAPAPQVAALLAQYHAVDRLTWGASVSALAQAAGRPFKVLLEEQLAPGEAVLPAAAQAQIDALSLSQQPFITLMLDLEQQRLAADALKNEEEKRAAQQAYQQELNRLAREAATRHLLRALYSPRQLQEQMTWFWLNHFSVFQGKANLRAMVGDFEDRAIRPRALGRFRDLLGAVILHPAMLRYLDNEQNAANRGNENLARELMELHTLGVDGPYTQKDVQELARVLTGVGVNLGRNPAPPARRELQGFHVRRGLFEFQPSRHDFNPKSLLGQPLQQRGLAEVEEALDRLAYHPATARHLSRKLVQYWLPDPPAPALVERVAKAFIASEGDIAQTLRTLLGSPEFARAAGRQFKDPMRFVVSALRLTHDDRVIRNPAAVLGWLNRLGQPLYGRQTPDGWPLEEAAWSSPGQMTARFEVARAIGSGSGGLFVPEGAPAGTPAPGPTLPQAPGVLFEQVLQHRLGPGTRSALAQATTPQEWNAFLLSSPEWMRR